MIIRVKKQFSRLLINHSFARGVTVLMGGAAGAQLLLLLAAPLLTRIYDPEDFGLVAVYASLLALFGVVSSLRYELAIPLPDNEGEAANVAVLCLILVMFSTFLTGVLVVLLGSTTAAALGVPTLYGYLWLLPVGVLITGFYSVFNYWAVRAKLFTSIAGTKLRQALTTIVIQLAAFKLGGIGLLVGQVAGQGVGTMTLGLPALKSAGFKTVSMSGIKNAAGRYVRFPIFSTWAGFANAAGLQLPPLMFAALFGPAAAGLYMLANRVLLIPMNLIGGAIGQVFFANAPEAYRVGKLGSLVAKLHEKLAHIGLPPALLLMLLGPTLFAFVFGVQWLQAGEFAQWMAPWLYLVFVSSPLNTMFVVVEAQLQGLAFQAILLVSRIMAIGVGAWIGDLALTIKLFAGVSAVCWLGFLFWVAHVADNPAKSMWQPTLHAAGFAVVIASPVLATFFLQEVTMTLWLTALSISALLLVSRYWVLLREAS